MILLQLVAAKVSIQEIYVDVVPTVFAMLALDSLQSIARESQPLLELCQ